MRLLGEEQSAWNMQTYGRVVCDRNARYGRAGFAAAFAKIGAVATAFLLPLASIGIRALL